MKRIFVLCIFATLGFQKTKAQDFSLGVKAGLNYTSLRGEETYDFDYKAGFHVGGFVFYRVNTWFALQTEAIYSQQGASQKIYIIELDPQESDPSLAKEELMIKFDLNYINIPLLAKFYPSERFHLLTGPQIGFLVSAKEKDKDNDYKKDIKKLFQKVDFGMVFGMGYDFDLGLTLQAQYYLGFVNINRIRVVFEDGSAEQPELKNHGFKLSLGYRF